MDCSKCVDAAHGILSNILVNSLEKILGWTPHSNILGPLLHKEPTQFLYTWPSFNEHKRWQIGALICSTKITDEWIL